MGTHARKIQFNLLSVVLCQVVTIAIGFLLPRLYIENFGSSVNGVLSTIKQIFTYLCLLEAGVGLATSQALLRPVATGDRAAINGILAATRRHYIRIGVTYAAAISLIAVIYGFCIDTGLPSRTVVALVLLNGIPSLVTFFVQGKYSILLETDGMQYVITNSQTALQVVSGFLKVAVLMLTDNLVLMQAAYCMTAVAQLLYVAFYAKKHYSWLDLNVAADFRAISQKNAVLLHQLSAMVFNNTDILLLSFLTDFNTVSVYYVYNLFFMQVETFIGCLAKGFNFALGQLFSVDRDLFLRRFRVYECLYIMLNFVVYTAMAVFLLPLIQIYTGGIRDADYIRPTLLLLFAVAKMLSAAKLPANQVIEYAGAFRATRWHAVCEMGINLSLTVVGILRFGICGALLGTVAAIVFRAAVTLFYTNRKILGRSVWKSLGLLAANGAVFGGIYAIFGTTHFCGMRFLTLCLHGILNMLWILPVYCIVNAIVCPEAFRAVTDRIGLLLGRMKGAKR